MTYINVEYVKNKIEVTYDIKMVNNNSNNCI